MKFLKIEITNFQKWKHLSIDFTDGVNCIIAPTDSGKSAIIRAILWVVFNKNYKNIRHKDQNNNVSDETSVKLTIENNSEIYVVERYISDKVSCYKLNGEEFKALNKKVPEKIQQLFSLSDINVQTQFEPPFLITSTSGDVSKLINEMIGLEEMDEMSQKVNTDVKECINEEKELEANKIAIEKQMDSFDVLSDFESIYKNASIIYSKLLESNQKHSKINLNTNRIKIINTDLGEVNSKLKSENMVDILKENYDKFTYNDKQIKELRNITKMLERKNIEVPDTTIVYEKYDKLNKTSETLNSITLLASKIVKLSETMRKCTESLNNFEKKLESTKVCPTCGRSWNE